MKSSTKDELALIFIGLLFFSSILGLCAVMVSVGNW